MNVSYGDVSKKVTVDQQHFWSLEIGYLDIGIYNFVATEGSAESTEFKLTIVNGAP
ncbi:hypothetical protein D3C77_669100 [compost metagenome]